VTFRILDINGKELKELAHQYYQSGKHVFYFNDLELPSGIYFLEMSTGNIGRTIKFIVK
jgi:hypothetical protein